MKKLTIRQEATCNIIEYIADTMSATEFINSLNKELTLMQKENILQILWFASKEWEKLPCEPDGFTTNQEKEADKLIDSALDRIFKVANINA